MVFPSSDEAPSRSGDNGGESSGGRSKKQYHGSRKLISVGIGSPTTSNPNGGFNSLNGGFGFRG